MRKAFMKRFAAVLMALCMLAALPVATAFAADDTGYVVTFRAGEHGAFTADYVQKLAAESNYGANNVYHNDTYTVVSVLVPDGKNVPDVPTATDMTYNADSTDYVLLSAVDSSYPAGKVPEQDYDFVATYALRGEREDVSYVVRYLLDGTEEEVAPSQRGMAPDGLTLTMAAISVNEFTPVGENVKEVTMEKNEDGSPVEVVFYYTQNVHVNTVTEYVDGDVVVNYNDVNLVGGAGVVGGGDGAGAGDGGEEIPDEETPQAGGEDIPDESTPQAGGEEIPDESTPEAGGETAQAGVSMPMVIGGVVGLLAILLIVLVALRKRKGGQEEE